MNYQQLCAQLAIAYNATSGDEGCSVVIRTETGDHAIAAVHYDRKHQCFVLDLGQPCEEKEPQP